MLNKRWVVPVLIGLSAVLLITVGILAVRLANAPKAALSKPDLRYQAVLLDTGSVYFGKLEGLEEPFVVLRDVYYVQTTTNPETKQANNVLVKRGKELHAPDVMRVNARHIVLVEPVTEHSKVAQLIAESHKSN